MALAVRVLDQEHFARADHALLAVARRDLDRTVEIDDVLPARRGVPCVIVAARRLAEDDAGRLESGRGLAARALVLPFDLDVAEMRLALIVDIEIVNAHRVPPEFPARQSRTFPAGDTLGNLGHRTAFPLK